MTNYLDVTGFVLLFLCECQCNSKSWLPCAPMCRVRMLLAADARTPGEGQIIDGMSQFRCVHKIVRTLFRQNLYTSWSHHRLADVRYFLLF